MKEPITVYTWVKTSESLPIGTATAKKGEFTGQLQIRKDGAYFYCAETILYYEFSDPGLYTFEWLKPQELITFTKEEWSEQEAELERLKSWKKEALEVMPDMQAIGKALNVRPGEYVHDKILTGIERLKGLIEKAFFDRGHSRAATEGTFNDFKIENNL